MRPSMSASTRSPSHVPRLHHALPVIAGAAYLLVYIVIALMRDWYPFELEWLEGASVVHVQRVLDGRPLYVPPSLDFVPFIYPPL
jgi:hypothetical protein